MFKHYTIQGDILHIYRMFKQYTIQGDTLMYM